MKRIVVILFLFSVALMNAQGSLIVDEGFESSASWEGGSANFKNSPGNQNASLVVGDAREGSGSVRLTGGAGAERSEITINGESRYYDWGTPYWVGVSMKINTAVGGFRVGMQHHAIDNSGNFVVSAGTNSFSITTISNTSIRLYTTTDPAEVFDTPGATSALGNTSGRNIPVITNATFNAGEWNDIVLHFKLETDNTGFYEIWINGVKVYSLMNGPTVYAYDSGGGLKTPMDYQKLGCYYGSGSASGDLQYDAFRIWKGTGGTYEDVSPLGLSPGSPAPTCSDGIQNGDETGIDCGGSCAPCGGIEPGTGNAGARAFINYLMTN